MKIRIVAVALLGAFLLTRDSATLAWAFGGTVFTTLGFTLAQFCLALAISLFLASLVWPVIEGGFVEMIRTVMATFGAGPDHPVGMRAIMNNTGRAAE